MPLQRRRDLIGAGGAPLEFPFTNQSTWNVPHNLGYDPHVTLVDDNGKEFKAVIDYVDTNNLTVGAFASPRSGKVIV